MIEYYCTLNLLRFYLNKCFKYNVPKTISYYVIMRDQKQIFADRHHVQNVSQNNCVLVLIFINKN